MMILKVIANTYQTLTKSQGLSKHIRHIISLNPQNNPFKEALLLSTFYNKTLGFKEVTCPRTGA